MNNRAILWAVWPCLALLAACSDRTQTISQDAGVDTAAFKGTGLPYVAPGWKQGDKASWEQHLKVRTQMGQNDYNKVQ